MYVMKPPPQVMLARGFECAFASKDDHRVNRVDRYVEYRFQRLYVLIVLTQRILDFGQCLRPTVGLHHTLEPQIEPVVEVDVRQDRRDDPSLWCSRAGMNNLTIRLQNALRSVRSLLGPVNTCQITALLPQIRSGKGGGVKLGDSKGTTSNAA
jgi:hypothetical protein